MTDPFKWLLARLEEPSTWAGIGLLVQTLQTQMSLEGPAKWAGIATAVVAGFHAVVKSEGSPLAASPEVEKVEGVADQAVSALQLVVANPELLHAFGALSNSMKGAAAAPQAPLGSVTVPAAAPSA